MTPATMDRAPIRHVVPRPPQTHLVARVLAHHLLSVLWTLICVVGAALALLL